MGQKEEATFSDALTAVRRRLWTQRVYPQAGYAAVLEQQLEKPRQPLLYGLAPAA